MTCAKQLKRSSTHPQSISIILTHSNTSRWIDTNWIVFVDDVVHAGANGLHPVSMLQSWKWPVVSAAPDKSHDEIHFFYDQSRFPISHATNRQIAAVHRSNDCDTQLWCGDHDNAFDRRAHHMLDDRFRFDCHFFDSIESFCDFHSFHSSHGNRVDRVIAMPTPPLHPLWADSYSRRLVWFGRKLKIENKNSFHFTHAQTNSIDLPNCSELPSGKIRYRRRRDRTRVSLWFSTFCDALAAHAHTLQAIAINIEWCILSHSRNRLEYSTLTQQPFKCIVRHGPVIIQTEEKLFRSWLHKQLTGAMVQHVMCIVERWTSSICNECANWHGSFTLHRYTYLIFVLCWFVQMNNDDETNGCCLSSRNCLTVTPTNSVRGKWRVMVRSYLSRIFDESRNHSFYGTDLWSIGKETKHFARHIYLLLKTSSTSPSTIF